MATKPKSSRRGAAFDVTISTTAAGDLLEIGAERVRQLIKDGYIERAARGQVKLRSAVQGYLRFRNEADRRASKSASASRVQDARAHEIEIRTAEREGRLIDLNEHLDLFAECFGALKAGLAGVPARLTRDMGFRRKIEQEIDDVLRQCADRFEQAARDPGDAGAAAEADAGDDA